MGDKDALLRENASLKEQLAAALANDVADAQAVADAARAVSDVAAAEIARLQSLVDADAAEDAALEELLGLLEASSAPVAEEAPTEG